jgi:hypothetical protein
MKKEEYQQMRVELGLCANIEAANPVYYAAMVEQLKLHPELDGVTTHLAFVHNKYPCPELHRNGRAVSMNECFIKGNTLEKKKEREFKVACRTTIEDQINAARTATPCEMCGSGELLEVDHIIHFQTLYEQHFGLTRPPYFKDAARRPVFKGEVARAWQEYHAANATFRMLCKHCNCARAKRIKI